MKKMMVIAAMAALSLGAMAQEKLTLSTYNGTNLTRYDGKGQVGELKKRNVIHSNTITLNA